MASIPTPIRHLALLVLAVTVITGASMTSASASPPPPMLSAADQPLVIIRFNQEKVLYKRSLYRALTKALDANPAMVFDVVSFAPQVGGDPGTAARIMNDAHMQASDVINTMQEMGLPRERISFNQQASPHVDVTEVHIFVR